jgi:pimeloyl-ACP methyl ester carboxylesterase
VAVGGVCLRGTCHKPPDETLYPSPDPDNGNPIGIVFLSWLIPRSGNGDSAVYWAESMAKCGYLAFRFDFPGLGDSDGDLSTPGIDVDAGAYGPALSGIANHLVERFHLSALVVVGHCAGALTALYAAAANEHIKGLILLDPYFHVQPSSKIPNVVLSWRTRVVKALAWDVIGQRHLRHAGVGLLSSIRTIYHNLNPNRLFLRRKKLPCNANLSLIRCWEQLVASGIRMLVLRSPTTTPKSGEFDYVEFLRPRSDSASLVTVKLIERVGAVACTHAFAERHGKETVRMNTEQWLSVYFPLTRYGETQVTGRHPAEFPAPSLEAVRNVR